MPPKEQQKFDEAGKYNDYWRQGFQDGMDSVLRSAGDISDKLDDIQGIFQTIKSWKSDKSNHITQNYISRKELLEELERRKMNIVGTDIPIKGFGIRQSAKLKEMLNQALSDIKTFITREK